MAHFKIAKLESVLNEFSPAVKTIEARGYSKDAAIVVVMLMRLEDSIDDLRESLYYEDEEQQRRDEDV